MIDSYWATLCMACTNDGSWTMGEALHVTIWLDMGLRGIA